MNSDDLTVSQATLEYVCGIDPGEMWKQRGLRGHRMTQEEKEDWHEEKQQRIKNGIEDDETRESLERFVAGADRIFERLIESPGDLLEEWMPDSRWIFIVGMARTGGTYLLSEVLKLMDEPIEQYGVRMIHDGIPLYENLAFWEREPKKQKLRYELAQFLLWANQEMSDLKVIPKKRISFAHALPVLDRIFGSKATYLFTLRHPGEISCSWAEMEDLNREGMDDTQANWWAYMNDRTGVDRERWESLGFQRRLLQLWEQYHGDLIDAVPLEGTVEVLRFGSAYPEFIQRKAREWGCSVSPDEFTSKNRDPDGWWSSGHVEKTIRSVRDRWTKKGLEWPGL